MRNKIQRYISLLTVMLLIVFALSACGSDEDEYDYTGSDQSYSSNVVDDYDIPDTDQPNIDDDYVPTPSDNPDYKLKKISKHPPQLYMREADLTKTSLGKPDKIEECTDFDKLDADHKSKEYVWGSDDDKNLWKVTVNYKRSRDGTVDNYEIYPDDNGYVSRLFYFNPKTGYYESKDA